MIYRCGACCYESDYCDDIEELINNVEKEGGQLDYNENSFHSICPSCGIRDNLEIEK